MPYHVPGQKRSGNITQRIRIIVEPEIIKNECNKYFIFGNILIFFIPLSCTALLLIVAKNQPMFL